MACDVFRKNVWAHNYLDAKLHYKTLGGKNGVLNIGLAAITAVFTCSTIMVLDRGQIVEFDAPRNLLKQETSVFYELAKYANVV
ncbi:hypothetical protein MTO96_021955 [Rhipicephalus appendiculatus]